MSISMIKFFAIFGLVLSAYSTQAWSQCAPGVPSAGNPGCIPVDRPESPYFHGNPDQLRNQKQAEDQVWSDRWGALVIDNDTGEAGLVANRNSKSEAIDDAMAACRKNGSQNCRLRIYYYNQCAAVAWGSGYNDVARAPTQEKAESNAMKECKKGADDCVIAYSECSLPVRVR